jgi:hypothetical protein
MLNKNDLISKFKHPFILNKKEEGDFLVNGRLP